MIKFAILPRRWRGIRNSEASVLLEVDEWADSKNFDSRFGWTNRGATQQITAGTGTNAVVALSSYYDVNGTLHRVWIDGKGDIYEDTTDIGFNLASGSVVLADSTTPIPYFARGTGAMVITRGVSQSTIWKDPGDSVWKELTGVLSTPGGATFDVGGPRLFTFPGSLGPDSWAWSVAGDFNDFTTANGGGEEPIGNDREDIIAIEGGLELNIAIYKRNHLYLRSGADPETWKIVPVSNDLGLTAPATLLRIGKSQFFVHDSGAYFLNGIGAVSFPSLTFRVQKTWDNMIDDFSAFLKYAHAAYHPREHTIYLWIPNQASRVMNRLLKIYIPDGSITIHDGKDSGGSHYFPVAGKGQIEFGADSKILRAEGLDDDGTAIAAQITSQIFSGSPPSFDMEKRWGLRGTLHLFFEAETAAQTVQITPRVYRSNSRLAGTQQSFTLTADQVSKVKVQMPDEAGWGVDFLIDVSTSTGRLRWLGYAGRYEEQTDE